MADAEGIEPRSAELPRLNRFQGGRLTARPSVLGVVVAPVGRIELPARRIGSFRTTMAHGIELELALVGGVEPPARSFGDFRAAAAHQYVG